MNTEPERDSRANCIYLYGLKILECIYQHTYTQLVISPSSSNNGK